MHKELSYLSPEGNTVFTSQFLKNRGTCCRSSCLHCPFGYTLKKCGIQFGDVSENDVTEIENILQEANLNLDWRSFLPENVKFIILKEKVAGLMFKNHIVVKHVALKNHFQNQGLNKDIIESYFFI